MLMILLAVFGKEYVIPIILGRKSLYELEPYVYSQPPQFTIDNSKDYFMDLETNFGIITIDLYEKSAPNNVNNLEFLAGRGYYNGTKFHRLFPDFMVQGGDRNTLDDDPTNDGRGGPGYFLDDEINWDSLDFSSAKREELQSKGYHSAKGLESQHLTTFSMAMASSLPDTNGSQFFIVLADPTDSRLGALDGYFTVVGKVYSGADVLDKMRGIKVDDPTSENPRPLTDIILENVKVYTR